jgi:polysaccharide export outer membrane protein
MRWFTARTILTACLVMATPLTTMAQAAPPASKPGAAAAEPAAAPPPVTPSPMPATSVDKDYILGNGDVIEVALVGRADFSGRTRIGNDGAVLLPYLGPFPASGRTPAQLADEISKALEKGGFFAHPVVRVDIVGVGSRTVTVLGAVSAPGLVPLDRTYHLSEIVARVGGRAGPGADNIILTHTDGSSKTYKLAELATGGGDKDPVVANGDKIYIPAAENQVFYVTGQVKSPGSYPVVEGMTVRIALARAGGLTDDGSEKKVTVKRKGVDLKGVKLDVTTLEPGDIVNVGERLF